MPVSRAWAFAVALLLAACATKPPAGTATSPAPSAKEATPPPAKEAGPPPAPKPAPPAAMARPKPDPVPEAPKEPPRSLGVDELAKGVRSYDDGDYQAAAKQFQAALDLGLAGAAERASAHKHLAFMACVQKRTALCRAEFRKAFDDDPAFDLTSAEAGHPTWGPVFRSVKAEVAKAKQKPRAKK